MKFLIKFISGSIAAVLLVLSVAVYINAPVGERSLGTSLIIFSTIILAVSVIELLIWFGTSDTPEQPTQAALDVQKMREDELAEFELWKKKEKQEIEKELHDERMRIGNEIINLQKQAATDTAEFEHEFHQAKENKRTQLAELDGQIKASNALLKFYTDQHIEDRALIAELVKHVIITDPVGSSTQVLKCISPGCNNAAIKNYNYCSAHKKN